MDKIIKLGRLFFAIAVAAIGAENLVRSQFKSLVSKEKS
jgi:hypothetical protein